MSRATTYVFASLPEEWHEGAAQNKLVLKACNPSAMQIKYLRVPDEIIDVVKEQQNSQQGNFRGGRGGGGGNRNDHGGRGGGDRGGRGRGRGGGRGRGRGA